MSTRRRMTVVVYLSAFLLLLTGLFARCTHVAHNGWAPSLSAVLPLIKAQDQAPTERPGADELPTVGKRSVSGTGTSDQATGRPSKDESGGGSGGGSGGEGTDEDPPKLSVSVGAIDVLYPGIARSVPLMIGNPFGFDIVVNTVTVSSTGTPACPASFLSLGTYDVAGPRIGARSTAAAMTTVALKASAPDSCQGARYTIRVKVEAGRA